jgi:hypothetical protein
MQSIEDTYDVARIAGSIDTYDDARYSRRSTDTCITRQNHRHMQHGQINEELVTECMYIKDCCYVVNVLNETSKIIFIPSGMNDAYCDRWSVGCCMLQGDHLSFRKVQKSP